MKSNASDAVALNDRGLTHREKDERDKPSRFGAFEADKINPKNAAAFFNRGLAHHRKGDYERAIEHYDLAIITSPGFAEPLNNRGAAHAQLQQHERALTDYNQAITLNPKYTEAFINRGHSYLAQGQYIQAIEDYDKAIELNPLKADAFAARGDAYGLIAQYDRAIADYTQAITLNPHDAGIFYSRGAAYGNKGLFDRARFDFDIANKLNANNPEERNQSGVASPGKGSFAGGKTDFARARQLRPDSMPPSQRIAAIGLRTRALGASLLDHLRVAILKIWTGIPGILAVAVLLGALLLTLGFAWTLLHGDPNRLFSTARARPCPAGQAESYSGHKARLCTEFIAIGGMGTPPVTPVPAPLTQAALAPVAAPPPPPVPAVINPTPAPAAENPPTNQTESLPQGRIFGARNASHVTLLAHKPARVTVLGPEKKLYLDRLLRPGDSYKVPNLPGLTLSTSAGDAVEIIVDGSSKGYAGRDDAAAESLPLNPREVGRHG